MYQIIHVMGCMKPFQAQVSSVDYDAQWTATNKNQGRVSYIDIRGSLASGDSLHSCIFDANMEDNYILLKRNDYPDKHRRCTNVVRHEVWESVGPIDGFLGYQQ